MYPNLSGTDSRFLNRRDLICAVFGLLAMVGRAAETARREDETGRPLPTSDLMGYGPLSIIFGPLLVGDMLDNYTMRVANPHGGLVVLPISPPKSRRDRHRKSRSSEDGAAMHNHIDKMKVAIGVTEMLITHWRDVVRMLKDLKDPSSLGINRPFVVRPSKKLRPSASESFILRKPPNWDNGVVMSHPNGPISPSPGQHHESLVVRKQRSRHPVRTSSREVDVLSPTTEEVDSPWKVHPLLAPKLTSSKSMNMLDQQGEPSQSPVKQARRKGSRRTKIKASLGTLTPTVEERLSTERVSNLLKLNTCNV